MTLGAIFCLFVVACLVEIAIGAFTGDLGTPAPEADVVSSAAIPQCEPLGNGVNNEACDANAESDSLRSTLLANCGLDDSRIEHDWWQESASSIEFNYTGGEGLNHGASIDVGTGDVICE